MVVVKDGLNPPFGLLVADLSRDEPVVELYCRCSSTSRSVKIAPAFKGWHVPPYVGFDLVVITGQSALETTATYEAVPLCFSLQGDGWHVAATNIADLDRIAGLRCYQKAVTSR